MSLENYRCQLIFAKDTKAVQVLDTVEFIHHYLTQPTLIHTDRILHGINTILYALKYSQEITCYAQLRDIT